jgi:hypothetical protein
VTEKYLLPEDIESEGPARVKRTMTKIIENDGKVPEALLPICHRGIGNERRRRIQDQELGIRYALFYVSRLQPRTAARARKLIARGHTSLRHRARGDVGRILGLMNEAARLEEGAQ